MLLSYRITSDRIRTDEWIYSLYVRVRVRVSYALTPSVKCMLKRENEKKKCMPTNTSDWNTRWELALDFHRKKIVISRISFRKGLLSSIEHFSIMKFWNKQIKSDIIEVEFNFQLLSLFFPRFFFLRKKKCLSLRACVCMCFQSAWKFKTRCTA